MSEATDGRRTRGGVPGALRREAIRLVAVLLIAGASLIGLHDWADAQATGPSTATSVHR